MTVIHTKLEILAARNAKLKTLVVRDTVFETSNEKHNLETIFNKLGERVNL